MSIEKAKKYLKEKEEKAKLSQNRDKEPTEYNRILVAAVWGRRDAANAMFRILADHVDNGNATEDQLQLIAKVLREIADNDQAVKFLAAEASKTKSPGKFFPVQKIFEAVESLHEEEGVPLISNNKESGAFERVANRTNVSESKVNRNYYAYKDILERVNRVHLSIPENRKKIISAWIQDREELLSVLTEEMTDEQKQEVSAKIWPVWVDIFIEHLFDA